MKSAKNTAMSVQISVRDVLHAGNVLMNCVETVIFAVTAKRYVKDVTKVVQAVRKYVNPVETPVQNVLNFVRTAEYVKTVQYYVKIAVCVKTVQICAGAAGCVKTVQT